MENNSQNLTLPSTSTGKTEHIVKYVSIGSLILIFSFLYLWVTNPIIISVTGTGSITVPATYAISQVTVAVVGADPNNSILTLENKVSSLRKIMNKNNVLDVNIAQSQPQLTPAGLLQPGATGYQASQVLSFKTKSITDISGLIVKLYDAGATIVTQPTYEAESQEQAERTAINEAMAKADAEAKSFAKTHWKLIRRIATVQQASSGTVAQTVVKDSKSSNLEIANIGGLLISKAVQVTYKIW